MTDKKFKTRERILAVTRQQLFCRGPAEPSVSEVMSAAGLTVGGFYSHFASKDELMLEAFVQLLEGRRGLLAQLPSELAGQARRVQMARFYLSHSHRDSQEEGCPLPSSLAEFARLPSAFREQLERHIELLVAELADAPLEADKVLADLALMVGGLTLARALGPGELSDQLLKAAAAAII
ncbi:MAG: TetR/AcrR family transcriptional repressor of nem operon [Pseudomonas sp.]|jgi:TetR/AcrR family transcriptional repressor of nem operon